MRDILCLVALIETFRGSALYVGSFFADKPVVRYRRRADGLRGLSFACLVYGLVYLMSIEEKITRSDTGHFAQTVLHQSSLPTNQNPSRQKE